MNPANSGQIMTINTGNLFVFEVGPSVKFVSAIIDAIYSKTQTLAKFSTARIEEAQV